MGVIVQMGFVHARQTIQEHPAKIKQLTRYCNNTPTSVTLVVNDGTYVIPYGGNLSISG